MPPISVVVCRCLYAHRYMLTVATSKGKQYFHSNMVTTSNWGFASNPNPNISYDQI